MRVGVALIVLLHVGLAALFAWVTPYRTPGIYGDEFLEDIGAPDESAHSRYVQIIAEGKGIPVIVEGRPLATDALGPIVVALALGLRYWASRYFAPSAPVLLLGFGRRPGVCGHHAT